MTTSISSEVFSNTETHHEMAAYHLHTYCSDIHCDRQYPHTAAFSDKWQKTANEYDVRRSRVHAQHEDRYIAQSRSLQPLRIGTEVRVQHATTKKWDRVGVIIGIGRHRDYHVKLPSGRVYWRKRRFHISLYGAPLNDAANDEPDDIDHDGETTCRSQPPDGPRRSNRRRVKPKSLNL